MEFLITSKGAININHIVNIYLAEVKEEEDRLVIDDMQIDGSIVGDLAKNYFESPCIGNKILTIVTTKTDYRAMTFRNQEAEEIWNQFLLKIN